MVTSTEEYECDAVTVTRDANCVEIADEMDANTIGCVVVVEDGTPVGIVSAAPFAVNPLIARSFRSHLDPDGGEMEKMVREGAE